MTNPSLVLPARYYRGYSRGAPLRHATEHLGLRARAMHCSLEWGIHGA
jgi:hypothetical protein